MNSPLENPEGLSWVAAAVQLPELPLLPPGQDAMSMTIAGVLPTLTAPFNASVAALSAKETMFSGKLGAAQTAYQDADDSGQQSVGQLAGMLGQVGQMGQAAGSPAQSFGGQTGMLGQLMQQAMQAPQGGGGSQGAGSQGGGQSSVGQGPTGAGAPQQQSREEADTKQDRAREQDDRDTRQHESRDERPPLAEAAGPDDRSHSADPVAPPDPRLGGDDDLARRM